MITCTFKLNGRNKTYTDETIIKCYDAFLDNYGEALDELKEVEIDGLPLETEPQILTGKGFKETYHEITDGYMDKVAQGEV